MSLLSWLYVLIFIAALVVLVWFRHNVIYAAAPKWGWRVFYFIVAVLIGGLTLGTSHVLSDYISGGFISGMFLLFAFWESGMTDTAIVNGLGTLRAYSALTKVQLQAESSGTRLIALVGEVPVIKMRFKQEPAVLAKFLKQHMPAERVVILT